MKTNTIPIVVVMAIVVTMSVAVSDAQADPGHFEGFENQEHSWNDYDSEGERVLTGTGGIVSSGGSYHLQITDPTDPEASRTGAYSWLGGKSAMWGGGWSSSIDIYINLADSTITSGTYGFHLSQSICDTTGSPYLQDNIWHVGAIDDGNGGYEIGVNTGHNTDTTPNYRVLNPANYHNESHGTFTQSGWYTFETAFGPSTSIQHPDNVDVMWTVYDADDNVVWSASETTEDYLESQAGGDGYLWFITIAADELNIDNVEVSGAAPIPLPPSVAMLLLGLAGVGGYRLRRKG